MTAADCPHTHLMVPVPGGIVPAAARPLHSPTNAALPLLESGEQRVALPCDPAAGRWNLPDRTMKPAFAADGIHAAPASDAMMRPMALVAIASTLGKQ
ncbi:hypothetical protein PX699_07660 [Sphingobium sp. H39-3-25]|uniref:hypothetical protein n=1 Tax=Sphingobium arseniciresistens TaxID=3030834 RepID=UPI0023B92AA6|nr:hypothetical protein [Sphingobium arseniciresistens]